MKASDYTLLATSEAYRDVTAFWRRQLDDPGDLTTALVAPTGVERPRQSLILTLTPSAAASLRAIANDSLGRFTVCTAGIALGLARYTNHSRVLLRTPLLTDDAEGVLNDERDVPLVVTAAGDATLRQFLQHAAHIVEESYAFQDYPIHTLCAQERGIDLFELADVSLSSTGIHGGAPGTRAPVHFILDDLDEGRVVIDFDPSVIDPRVADGLMSVIAATLEHFKDLSTSVRSIDRVPAGQRDRLLVEWNRTETAATPFSSAHALFEAQVRRTPEATAVRFGDETLTYRELDEHANRLAHHLIDTAPTDGSRAVGIWMDRSPWMVVAVFGVLKAGCAYVPIDTSAPPDRLAFLVQDSGIGRLLIDAHRAKAAAALACEIVVADSSRAGAATPPAVTVGPSDLAYILYTSGSTGTPKGCAIEHHSLSNYLRWAIDYYWTTATVGTMGLFTPLSFDLTVPSLFCPLLRGRVLVVYPQDAMIDDVLRRQFEPGSTIDSIKLTPSHLRILDAFALTATDVRLAIVGGEALTPEQVAVLHRIDPRIRVINEYGPTEATVGCIVTEVAPGAAVVIGRPIANMRAYVLDDDQQPVPIGVRGELCIGGEGVARGYLGRPELEAERFLPNPFVPGDRIYRTGDIARWLPDGELECFGRLDSQVKIRGYRIEPGEVEAALRHCSSVREAVVVANAGQLVAYVVSDDVVDQVALRQALNQTLPHYMVPAVFMAIAEVPLTANGKIDRARLPDPSPVAQSRRPYLPPRTTHERVVATIWERVFRLDHIGVDEDFFELGGHSLRAMTIMQGVHQALGLEVSIGEILSHPTIGALAGILTSRTSTAATRIAPVPGATDYAVSHGQRRLWLIDRIEEDSPAYNVSSAFDLRGPLDLDALGTAFDAVVARHESLRTIFVEVDDEPRQRVLPLLQLPIEYVDLRDEIDQTQRLETLAARQAATPFDLGRGPLLRVSVFQLEDARAILAVTMHHIVTDAWSMRVLLADLIGHYESARRGADVARAPLPIQYRDYAAWQRRLLTSHTMEAHRQYWLTKLAGPWPVLALPTDFTRPPVPSYRGRHHHGHIDALTRAKLRALGAAHAASPFMTLTAIVKALLFRYTGQSDVRIGSPIAGRMQVDLAEQIGFYVNTLVLRDEVRGDESFDAFLNRVKHTAEEAYTHQLYPFDKLVEELGVDRDLSRSPLFDVMVTYDNDSDAPLPTSGLTVQELSLDSGVSKFDLTFAFAESEQGIDLEVEYRTDLFRAERIARMTTHLLRLIESVVLSPAAAINRLEIGEPIEAGATDLMAPVPAVPADLSVLPPLTPLDGRDMRLVQVLESVLGRTRINTSDNFFFIGGDSIKAIQLVNRLARMGWTLRVRDVFEAPRIDALAGRMEPATAVRRRAPVAGDVPLTPIQRWFFQTHTHDRAHYNQSVMLRFVDRLDATAVRRLCRALVEHHDVLRLRYRFDANAITQFYGEPYDAVEVCDLRNAASPIAELEHRAVAVQASLDLERGPLARFVLFQLPDADRLLAVIHHLAVDGVSWRILLEDLRTGLAQAARGETIQLGARSDSYQAWSLALEAHTRDVDVNREWWDAVEQMDVVPLPVDIEIDDDQRLEADAVEQRLSLSAGDTAALLSRVHQAYNTRMQDVLLAALARALRTWAGPGAVRLDVEAHGRDAVDAVDVSRTVGWFTTLYPIVLAIGDEPDPGAQITIVKESLRQTPGHGLGYGLLRRGRPSGAPILFNFLGQFDTDIGAFEMADEHRGPEHGPRAPMTHALVIGGWIAEGRLQMTVRHSRAQFRAETIARLMTAYQDALTELIAHCAARASRVRTISDFRYTDSTTPTLLAHIGADRVEDIYPLTPMQQGMLYHSVLGDDSPVYVEQFTCAITGPLDVAAFRTAWEHVITRHASLRTAFFWREIAQPVQVVFTHVDAPWVMLDWRALTSDECKRRLAQFVDQDRRRSPDLDTPPLMRFTLIRTSDQGWQFYWTSHHLVLDGWSTATVLQEVFSHYQSSMAGEASSLGPVRQFGEFVDWLRAQAPAPAEQYWRDRLRGFTLPTPLPLSAPTSDLQDQPGVTEWTMAADASAALAATIRDQHLTMSTVARGVWALVLGAHARQDDVVFGATVAGRPAALPGVETIVGLFINTLPIRVRIDPQAPLTAWLHRLQIEQAELDAHAYSSLAEIQRVSDIPARTPLFDSLLVVENYPVDQSLDPGLHGLAIEDIAVAEQTNYPLTLTVVPGEQVLLRLSYHSRDDEAGALALLREVEARFSAFAQAPQQPVHTCLALGEMDIAAPQCRYEVDTDHATTQTVLAALRARYATNEDLHENDLVFTTAERQGGTVVEAASGSGRFDEAFLQRTRDHFVTLAAALSANPDEPVARLPLLPDAERTLLLEEFNRTDRDWGSDRTIAQYFEAQAAAHPDRIAVRLPALDREDMSHDETWTYGVLNARANQLARTLVREHGVGPDVRVGVLAERSLEMVLALMAIEKAGGAYVPMDPEYPGELLQFMIEDSGAAVILAQRGFLDHTAHAACPVVALDAVWDRMTTDDDSNLPSRVTGDNLAYVIYTSGSTGRPKGAMNTHAGITNRLLWMQDAYSLTEHDRVLQKTPFSFDVSVWEFFWPLMVGAQLVVARPGGHRDAAYLVALIEHAAITTLHFVPSMLQAFIEEPGLEHCRSLQRVVCSGEAITPELLRRYLSRVPVPLHNLYGPTEAAVDVTAWPCTAADTHAMVPIGTPIANIRLYILDPLLQPVPLGVTGELFLGGVGVGRGYLNRPELTAEKFIPDPFSASGGARLYRTGDLARYRDTGVVDFLGRIDHQVKLRGFRIELGEIESALLAQATVRECVVLVREDRPGAKRLVAYVVPQPGAAPETAALRAYLRQHLPDHMVPAVIVTLADLPRLTNGKLDRKALPVPEDVVETTRRHVAPRDPIERRLLRVWEDVLGQKMIGVTDDFFELGGHSLLALKLVGAIHVEFGRSLPLAQLLGNSTVERLAVVLKREHDDQDWRPLVAIRSGRAVPPLFLLPGAGGNVLYFHTLAQVLTTTRPIYGLQALGLDGRTPPLTTVEAIAAANIEEMRRVQPHGPYVLVGHSFGGRVALEMAQQLAGHGESIGLLAVLDTAAPTFDPAAVGAGWLDAHWLAKIAREIEEFFGIRLEVTLDDLLPLPLEAQLLMVVSRMQEAGAWAPGADLDQLRGYLQVYKAHSQAAYVRYEDTSTRVPIALFKAAVSDPDLEATPAGLEALNAQHDWGWSQFARGAVRVYDVPGGHLSMLTQPHVPALATALDEALAAAEVPA